MSYRPLRPQDAARAALELHDVRSRFADHLRDEVIAAHAACDSARAAQLSAMWRLWTQGS